MIPSSRNLSTNNFFLPTKSLFRQVGSGVSYFPGSTFTSLLHCRRPAVILTLGDPIALLHHIRFHLPNFKLLSLSAQLEHNAWQSLEDTCCSEQRRYKFSHSTLFKLLTGRAATAGTDRWHVSHRIESLSQTYSLPKPETQV